MLIHINGNVFRNAQLSKLIIIGPDNSESPEIAALLAPLDMSQWSVPGEVIVDSLQIKIESPANDGVLCSVGTTLRLRRVTIEGSSVNGTAIKIDGCRFEMDRSAIVRNSGNVLEIDGGEYQITNSIFAYNGLNQSTKRNIYLQGAGKFQYNTVYNNGPKTITDAQAIACAKKPAMNLIGNSIIVQNYPRLNKEQVDMSTCTLVNNFVGDDDSVFLMNNAPDSWRTGLLL